MCRLSKKYIAPNRWPPVTAAGHELRWQRRQGNRILRGAGQNGEQIIFTPAGAQAFGFDADFGGLFLAQQVEGQMAQHGKVLRSMTLADTAGIFVETDV